ncbi:hypothetical protein AMK15_01915 [Streptomyces sp. MJM1172]|nr:hypothetical protein AMK15_01915 [Streptomyces sp. MJM1172]
MPAEGTGTYEITGPIGHVPVLLTEAEAAGFVFAGWTGGEYEAGRKSGRQKIMDAYEGTERVGDKHPQDAWVLQHGAMVTVWEAARQCDNFQDFKEAMERLTLRLRWSKTRADFDAEERNTDE